LDLGGYPVTVLDTAGIREAGDPVEQEGVRRASAQAASADLVLWLLDATETNAMGLPAALDQNAEARLSPQWIVVNKIDLVSEDRTRMLESQFKEKSTVHLLSSRTGQGVDEMARALGQFAEAFFTPEPALVTRARQRRHLNDTVLALRGAQRADAQGR